MNRLERRKMFPNTSERQIAVFIDFENIVLSMRDRKRGDSEIDWELVLEQAIKYGRVVVRRAYGDWSSFSANQRELLRLGIDLVHVPSKRGKNAADIRIVIDALEMMLNEHMNISHVMLISGDGDFTELVHRLRVQLSLVLDLDANAHVFLPRQPYTASTSAMARSSSRMRGPMRFIT